MRIQSLILIPGIVLLPALIALSLPAYSQSAKEIGLGTGCEYGALKSELISPLTHTGTSLPFQLFFRSGNERNRHHLQVYYTSRNLSAGGISTEEVKASFQYAYHRKIGVLKSKITLWGGGVLESEGSQRENLQNGAKIGNNERFVLITQISPSLLAEIALGQDRLSVQAWIAIVGYAFQNGYASSYPLQNNWVGPKDFQDFESRVSYTKYASSRFDLRLDYQFQFCKLDKYESIHTLNHGFVVSLVYKIH